MNLPDEDIVVVHRSDGSGTTNIFTDYLATANADWNSQVGKGKDVKWPVGLGGKGNEGVSGQVAQTERLHRLRRAGLRHPEQAAVRA